MYTIGNLNFCKTEKNKNKNILVASCFLLSLNLGNIHKSFFKLHCTSCSSNTIWKNWSRQARKTGTRSGPKEFGNAAVKSLDTFVFLKIVNLETRKLNYRITQHAKGKLSQGPEQKSLASRL